MISQNSRAQERRPPWPHQPFKAQSQKRPFPKTKTAKHSSSFISVGDSLKCKITKSFWLIMKKLYRKGTVHPTPPLVSDHLSFLPATILTLTVALSPEDREVLAYLLSCSTTNSSGNLKNNNNNRNVTTVRTSSSGGGGGARGVVDDHPPSFNCYCFRCYMSYWVRWDSSPNRQLIHEIIDAFEDSLLVQSKKNKGKKDRKKGKVSAKRSKEDELINSESTSTSGKDVNISDSNSVEENGTSGDVPAGGGGGDVCVDDKELGSEKGSVRRFFSFVGEKIWGVWT